MGLPLAQDCRLYGALEIVEDKQVYGACVCVCVCGMCGVYCTCKWIVQNVHVECVECECHPLFFFFSFQAL